MLSRRRVLGYASAALLTAACAPATRRPAGGRLARDARAAMKRATGFMREHCAVHGGYVWSYLPDFSRRWGEMEAYPSMIWIQPPGTATVGHLFLDCYHATGDAYYYEAACEVADGLVEAQHAAGGWNYLHDFAGEDSVRRWYDTIGANGWRLEEFQHYHGNATFDDAGTSEASQFLLRLYLEEREERYAVPLEHAIRFVLDSQYDIGGWPQRYPFVDNDHRVAGARDYMRDITFNDDVGGENIKFLLMVWQTLGDDRARAAIDRAMQVYVATLQPEPQAGWGLQHDVETLKPVAARSYEPEALTTHTTAGNVALMLDFYEWTGERHFLARIDEALAWLDSVRLAPAEIRMPGREFPTFIEPGTNRALIVHRRGSNVVNGEYYHDYDPDDPIVHYSQWRALDLDGLRGRYRRLAATSPAAVRATSPLARAGDFRLPRYFTTRRIEVSDLNASRGARTIESPDAARAADLVAALNDDGYWPTPLTATSNPYAGEGSPEAAPGDYSQTRVGDATDTSPYVAETPAIGISTAAFIDNMSALMQVAAES